MSTPLSAIGKYNKYLIVILGVMLMFAFVVAEPLMQYAGGSAGGGSRDADLVASWKGGRMNERQLEQAVVHRNILAEFQQQVFTAGYRDALEDGVEDLGLRVDPIELPRSREQGVETSVVRTKIFAERAREAGMVVTDEMVNDYLRALGRDRVSNDQMRQMLSRMNVGGRRATTAFVFDLLREAMLANNYLSSHAYVFRTILPEERWDDWKKVNERVVVEAAPLRVEDFIDEVPEPTDAELAAFFEEHKEREPTTEVLRGYGNVELPSSQPAFATPPRVKLTYLKANFNAAVEQLVDQVTDEEIAAFYEANKESFIEADRALFGEGGSVFGSPDDVMADDTSAEVTEEDGTLPFGDSEPEDSTDEAPADAADDAAMEAEEPATEETAAVDAEEDSVNPLRRKDATETPVEEEEEEEEEPASDDAADAETASDDDEAAEAESDDKPYQPLSDVADEIRRRLAIERAAEAIQKKMDRIKSQLDDEFVEYFDEVIEAEAAGPDAELPAAPAALADLKPLAEEEQLELVQVDLATQFELRDTTVGGSVNADLAAQRALPAWFVAFRPDDLDLYQPLVTRDIDGNRYLILVTDRYEREVPELDDVREQVVAAWKRVQAADLALEKAEALAKEASESGKSLTALFADDEDAPVDVDSIEETDAFTLFTLGPVAPSAREVPLRLSQPAPLVAAGPELLQGVFELEAGQVGAELNHDRSIAYLLRIAQKIGTEDELRQNFLRDGDRWVGMQSLMQARAQNKLLALLGNLMEESGLEWERTPDQLR